jgi:hypothetical protein
MASLPLDRKEQGFDPVASQARSGDTWRMMRTGLLVIVVLLGLAMPAQAGTITRVLEFGGYDSGGAVVAQSNGWFLIVGDDGRDIVLARMRVDGTVDRSFGEDGRARSDFGSREDAAAAAVDGTGRILVAGTSGEALLVARLRADGSRDPTFGRGGAVKLSVPVDRAGWRRVVRSAAGYDNTSSEASEGG